MKVVYYEIETTPSTNETAKKQMHLWNPYALTVVSTRKQTAGKGKFNTTWRSSPKDLTLSLCFFITELNIDRSQLFRLGTESVLALTREWHIPAHIKWPNDVLVHHEKLSGVLCETLPVQKYLGVIIGIGLNVNSGREELAYVGQPATSLSLLLHRDLDIEELQSSLVHHARTLIQDTLAHVLPMELNDGKI